MTHTFKKTIVDIPHHSYPVYIGEESLSTIGPIAAEEKLPSRICIISDTTTDSLYGAHVSGSLVNFGFTIDRITIEPGEDRKNLDTVGKLYDMLFQKKYGRDSALIALGGGVVGDITGFAAATYLRGLSYVQVPTTLLAQVDSSVGGKVGVNLQYGKNLVGAFYQPRFVFIDVKTLSTLPERELRGGFAEVIKYALILDKNLFDTIDAQFDSYLKPEIEKYTEIVYRCCKLKAGVVSADEKEAGYREILNFGHTIGHALEALSGFGTLTHGEAILYGMRAETMLSEKLAGLPEDRASRIYTLLDRVELPGLPADLKPGTVYEIMQGDKKVRDGNIRFTLLSDIGEAKWGVQVEKNIILEILERFF